MGIKCDFSTNSGSKWTFLTDLGLEELGQGLWNSREVITGPKLDKKQYLLDFYSVSDIVFDILLFYDYLEFHTSIVYVSSMNDRPVKVIKLRKSLAVSGTGPARL